MTFTQSFINEKMEMNQSIRRCVLDESCIVKFGNQTKFIAEWFLGLLIFYTCLKNMTYVQVTGNQLVQIAGVTLTVIIVSGMILTSYLIMERISARFDALEMEKRDLIQQLNVVMDENTALINQIMEYEDKFESDGDLVESLVNGL